VVGCFPARSGCSSEVWLSPAALFVAVGWFFGKIWLSPARFGCHRHILVVAGVIWQSPALFRRLSQTKPRCLAASVCCHVFGIRISQPQTGISLSMFRFPLVQSGSDFFEAGSTWSSYFSSRFIPVQAIFHRFRPDSSRFRSVF
jgi:hypothetical protein